MKRVIFTTLMFVVMSSFAFAQTLGVYISGQVTNSATGAPVANHQVFISTDSTNPNMPGISVVATTNPNGVYQVSIPLTSTIPMVFFVSTIDCNGNVQMQTVTAINTMQLTVNFSICVGIQPPPPCNASFTVIPVVANPMKYYFQNTSGAANNYSCQWSFGDGTSAIGYNTYHIYSQPGTYTVCLTIINQAANCYDTVCHTVTVAGNPPPPCNVTFSAMPDSANSQLWHFAGTSSNPNTNLLWLFGDGTNGNGPLVQHLYQSPGTYVVCAKIPGANGTILCYTCDTIVVSGNPPLPCNASFTISPVSTNPNKFYFHSTSTGANQFVCHWSFGDGTTGTGNNTYHIYSQPGTYTVCLTIMNQAANCYDTICHTVTVAGNPPPPCNADFTVIADSTNSSAYHFVATNPSLIGMYHWSFGDGTNGYGPVSQHQYLNAGTYVVCLVVSNTGAVTCTSCDTIVVGVTPPPPCQANFAFAPCLNSVNCFHFEAIPNAPGVQYLWTFGDNSPAVTAPNPYHTFTQPGTYQVCLVVTFPGGCVDSVCQTVTVGTSPPPCNATFTAIQDSVNDHLYHFFANYPNAGPFTWSFGDGTSGYGAVVHHVYQNAGNYVVCLHVVSPAGQITCSECDTIQVTGNPVPTYHIWGHVFAGANTLLDKGKVRLFKLSMTNVGAQLVATTPVDSSGAYHFYNVPAGVYYIKAKPGPMSQFFGQFLPTYYPHNVFWGNATPVVIPQVNNPYNINLKPAQTPVPGPGMIGGMITQGYKFSGSGAPVSDVEILLKPTSGDPFIFAESNANGEFNFNDLDYGTYEVYPEVTGLATIPATITLNANNPSATNINMVISPNQVATAISDDMDNMKMFSVYPNPASTAISLDIVTEMPVDAVLSITDLTGRLISTENVTHAAGKQKFSFDLSTYENGTYLLQFRTDQGSVNYRKFTVIK